MADSENRKSAPRLVVKTVDVLGRRIVKGDVPPGQTLPVEQDISDELGVSRNVVREAVKTLSGKNLIRSARRAGTIVEPREAWNLLDPQVLGWMLSEESTRGTLLNALSELRAIIEPEAAALAARRGSSAHALRLLEIYGDMERHARDPERAIAADVSFHVTILEATGNLLLTTFAEPFGQLLKANFSLSIQVNGAFIRNLAEHEEIALAIRDRDPDRARDVARLLLSKNEADLDRFKQNAQRRSDAG